jgi:murein L,D-transpeptidase YcbB/YkuD
MAGGPNFHNAIQVEIIGFARDSHSWPGSTYAALAKLARWIEANAGVARQSSVSFRQEGAAGPNAPQRLSMAEWLVYSGHLGHQHVPGNDHWDPGLFNIVTILGPNAKAGVGGKISTKAGPCDWPGVFVQTGDSGATVRRVQKWLNAVRDPDKTPAIKVDGDFGKSTGKRLRQFQNNHNLDADGVVGPTTWTVLCRAAKEES